jgi:hypothetical protein
MSDLMIRVDLQVCNAPFGNEDSYTLQCHIQGIGIGDVGGEESAHEVIEQVTL